VQVTIPALGKRDTCTAGVAATSLAQVRISVVEIYCERIRDLLDPTRDNLQVKQDSAGAIFIDGWCLSKPCTDRPQHVVSGPVPYWWQAGTAQLMPEQTVVSPTHQQSTATCSAVTLPIVVPRGAGGSSWQ